MVEHSWGRSAFQLWECEFKSRCSRCSLLNLSSQRDWGHGQSHGINSTSTVSAVKDPPETLPTRTHISNLLMSRRQRQSPLVWEISGGMRLVACGVFMSRGRSLTVIVLNRSRDLGQRPFTVISMMKCGRLHCLWDTRTSLLEHKEEGTFGRVVLEGFLFITFARANMESSWGSAVNILIGIYLWMRVFATCILTALYNHMVTHSIFINNYFIVVPLNPLDLQCHVLEVYIFNLMCLVGT